MITIILIIALTFATILCWLDERQLKNDETIISIQDGMIKNNEEIIN